MADNGPRLLRQTTNHVLDALMRAAETAYRGQPIGMHALHDLVDGLKSGSHFDEFYSRAYRELAEVAELDTLTQKRSNAFGRLMIHPLSDTFQREALDRDMLPNVFSFFHMVLGDDAQVYSDRCMEIAANLRARLEDQFTWDAFYEDRDAKRIQWRTLVRVAASFKRWDLRKDWFMKLMQYTPTTVSVAQNAFVVKDIDRTEEPRPFGNHEFCAFFQGLFLPLTDISKADEDLFRTDFDATPHHLIGDFLMHLATCEI